MVIDFGSFYGFPSRFDRLFEEYSRPFHGHAGIPYPPLLVSEDEHNVYIKAEIPGVDMEDVDLTVTDKNVVIRGERKVEQGKYYRQERPTGAFQRIIQLGVPVDRESCKATLADGILSVVLPKVAEARPQKISIEIA